MQYYTSDGFILKLAKMYNVLDDVVMSDENFCNLDLHKVRSFSFSLWPNQWCSNAQQYCAAFNVIIGTLYIQLPAPQIVQWLQLVIQQLEDYDDGYNDHEDHEEAGSSADGYDSGGDDSETGSFAVVPPAPAIPTGVFSISAFNEHVQREHHTVLYATQSNGPAHLLTWISQCTSKCWCHNIPT